MVSGIVSELPSRELAEIGQYFLERLRLKALVKKDPMQMRGHNDIGIGPESLVVVTKVEAVRHDLEGGFGNEHG